MKRFIVILLMLCAVCDAAYNSSNVEAFVGGVPMVTNVSWGAVALSGGGQVMVDKANPILFTGNITTLKTKILRASADTIDIESGDGLALKILSLDTGTYTVEHSIDLTADWNALPANDGKVVITKTGTWAVQEGWFLGIYQPSTTTAASGVSFAQSSIRTGTLTLGDALERATVAPTGVEEDDTFTTASPVAGRVLQIEALSSTNEYITTNNDNSASGFVKDDSSFKNQ